MHVSDNKWIGQFLSIHLILNPYLVILDCGSTLTAQKGILVSPDYPGSHKGAVECVWEIEGQQGEIIALNLKEMDINGDKDCNNSRVQVRDRENSTVIGNFCGEEDDRRVESHGNHMWIKFESNGKTKGERFRIEYERGENFRVDSCVLKVLKIH